MRQVSTPQHEPQHGKFTFLSRASAACFNRHGDLRPWMSDCGSDSATPSLPTFVARQPLSKPASRISKLWELMKLKFESFAISRRISRAESSVQPDHPQTDDLPRYNDWH